MERGNFASPIQSQQFGYSDFPETDRYGELQQLEGYNNYEDNYDTQEQPENYNEYYQNRQLYLQQQINRQYQGQYEINPQYPQYQTYECAVDNNWQHQQQMRQYQYLQQQQQQFSYPFQISNNYHVIETKDNVGFDYSSTWVNANLYKERFKRNIVIDKPQEGDNTSRDVKTDFQRELGAQVLSHLPDVQQQKLRTNWIAWCPGSSSKDGDNNDHNFSKPSLNPNSVDQPFSAHLHSFQDIIKHQPFIAEKGYDMAIRMGYNPERGLGKDEDGDMLPINVLFTRGSTGLGSIAKNKRGTMVEHCKICDRDFPMNDFKTHCQSKKHQKNCFRRMWK